MLDRRLLYRAAAVLICLLWTGDRLAAKTRDGASPTASAASASSKKKKSVAKKAAAAALVIHKAGTTAGRKSSRASTKANLGKHDKTKAPTARSIKLTSAFMASTQLRPMAQQLAATRSAAAYGGVLSYAQNHPGEGAAAAYLALGHAYMLDHRFGEATSDFIQAKRAGEALDDYADYIGAQTAIQAGRGGDAYALLDHFADHYPDSIFAATAPVLLANAHLHRAPHWQPPE